MSRSPLSLLLLLACGDGRGIQLPTHDVEHGSSIALQGVEPAWGNGAGGAEVLVRGGPFADDSAVWFGDSEAEILEIGGDFLRVILPAHEAGTVALRVHSGDADLLREAAFTYYADASGQVGAFGAMEWYTLLGDYWQAGSADFGQAWWGLIEPGSFYYDEVFGGELDACVSGLSFPAVSPMQLGVEQSSLQQAAGLSLTGVLGEDGFYGVALDDAPAVGVGWDLQALEAGPLAGLAVQGLVALPQAPVLTAPALDGDEAITLRSTQLDLAWQAQAGEPLYVLAVRYDLDLQEQETVGCVVDDDGAFTVPPEVWTQAWDGEGWVFLYLGSAQVLGGELPHNGSESGVVGISWVMGAALTAR